MEGWEGDRFPLQGVFAFLRFKKSNLVHAFGEFDGVQPVRKELKGRGWRGIPPPTQGSFCIFRVLNKRSGAYFG